jgi:transcriptional regulator with XRE-family HTH domain
MIVPTRDPADIAKIIKFLREASGMKAETLAELSGLNVRSIERAESGRHLPSEQTLQQIARAFKVGVSIFDPVDHEALRRELDKASRKTVLIPMTPVENPAEVMALMDKGMAYQHDLSSIHDDAALDLATEFIGLLTDWGDAWGEVSLSDRLGAARDFVAKAQELAARGYETQMGSYRARHLGTKSKLTFTVTLITFRPKGDPGKYAMVTLPEHLETLPEDRITVPPDPRASTSA